MLVESVRLVEQLLTERRRRERGSALVSAAFENASAALGLHSLTETVHLALRAFFGLISSFHDVSKIKRLSPQYHIIKIIQ